MPCAAIGALCHEAVARSGIADGYLRLVVTRGAGRARRLAAHLRAPEP